MPSPFPGMDPYLEQPGLWPDVHHELISVARELLNRKLRPKYHVRVEERIYISDENDPGRTVIVPDLRIKETRRQEELPDATVESSTAAIAVPVRVTTLIEDEIHEARLEIVDHGQRSVVTVVEILSPSNKVAGSRGQASYQQKRHEVMHSQSHFVEIDLLRSGVPIWTRELLPDGDYFVHLSRKEDRPQGLVWPILLPQRLPAIQLPLLPEDPDTELDLQTVLDTAYDRAGYDLEIDYRQEPQPELPAEYTQWADQLLREKGFR